MDRHDSDVTRNNMVIFHDVFISYSFEDKAVADAICNRLESERIRCWIAPRDVLPGQNYPEAIVDAIDTSKIMILVFSSHSNNSPHVIRELMRAVNREVIIVPFKIENIEPSKAMEYLISIPHWLDAVTPPLEKSLDKVVAVVKKILKDNQNPPISHEFSRENKRQFRNKSKQPSRNISILSISLIVSLVIIAILTGIVLIGATPEDEGKSPPPIPISIPPITTLIPTTSSTIPPTTIPTTVIPSIIVTTIIPTTMIPESQIDLQHSVAFFNTVCYPGKLFWLEEHIKNGGDMTATSFKVRFYLSEDKKFDPLLDVYLGNGIVNRLPPGSETFYPVLTVPSETIPGDYNLVGVIDPENQISEIIEANNVFWGTHPVEIRSSS